MRWNHANTPSSPVPRTGPLPASSMPKQQSSVRQMSGIGDFSRQLNELSASNGLRSMGERCKEKEHRYSCKELKNRKLSRPETQLTECAPGF